MTVTVEGVTSEVSETGNGEARVEVFAQVTYQSGLESFAMAGEATVEPMDEGTVVLEIEAEVPDGNVGNIQVELRSFASAIGAGNAADASLEGQLTDITVTALD